MKRLISLSSFHKDLIIPYIVTCDFQGIAAIRWPQSMFSTEVIQEDQCAENKYHALHEDSTLQKSNPSDFYQYFYYFRDIFVM